jgi:hypothetical protein
MEKLVVFRLPERLNPSRTVNGWPELIVVMLFSCQPFASTAATPLRDLPNGRS